jgi:hypothetical protein
MLRGLRSGPCPKLNVNFPMELDSGSEVGHNQFNGATRIIAGTQHSTEPLPPLAEES